MPDAEIAGLLEPWLGAGGLESDIAGAGADRRRPRPRRRIASSTACAQAVAAAAPAARVDDNGQWLAPLASLIGALKWLAAGLVLLMVGATAATVVLAARAALDTHRGTIEVLHLMGATDVQVARLFQRRIALDALFGGLVGFILAALVLIGIGERVSRSGSELLGSAGDPGAGLGDAGRLAGVRRSARHAGRPAHHPAGAGADAVIRFLFRVVAFLLLLYALGYAVFAVLLPKPGRRRARPTRSSC